MRGYISPAVGRGMVYRILCPAATCINFVKYFVKRSYNIIEVAYDRSHRYVP